MIGVLSVADGTSSHTRVRLVGRRGIKNAIWQDDGRKMLSRPRQPSQYLRDGEFLPSLRQGRYGSVILVRFRLSGPKKLDLRLPKMAQLIIELFI